MFRAIDRPPQCSGRVVTSTNRSPTVCRGDANRNPCPRCSFIAVTGWSMFRGPVTCTVAYCQKKHGSQAGLGAGRQRAEYESIAVGAAGIGCGVAGDFQTLLTQSLRAERKNLCPQTIARPATGAVVAGKKFQEPGFSLNFFQEIQGLSEQNRFGYRRPGGPCSRLPAFGTGVCCRIQCFAALRRKLDRTDWSQDGLVT